MGPFSFLSHRVAGGLYTPTEGKHFFFQADTVTDSNKMSFNKKHSLKGIRSFEKRDLTDVSYLYSSISLVCPRRELAYWIKIVQCCSLLNCSHFTYIDTSPWHFSSFYKLTSTFFSQTLQQLIAPHCFLHDVLSFSSMSTLSQIPLFFHTPFPSLFSKPSCLFNHNLTEVTRKSNQWLISKKSI